jgi:hypothetical protein
MSLILSGTDGLSDVDGSASTPAIRGTDTNTGIFFPAADTIAFAEGGAEVARFDSNGNLGIGTTSPSFVASYGGLQINGAGNGSVLHLTNSFTGATSTDGFDLILAQGSADAYVWQRESAPLIFGTSATERMRIDSSGNLLVGTTSSGSFANGFQVNNGSYGNSVIVSHNNTSTTGIGYLGFYWSSGQIGSITQNGTTAVSYNTTSDYRLKENIAPMVGALAKVSALKPCTYTWKSAPDEIGEGFIAHELAEVCPQAVTGEKDAVNEDGSIKAQSIDTSFLVATLTAAIQEQQAIITDLKSRIEALEAK